MPDPRTSAEGNLRPGTADDATDIARLYESWRQEGNVIGLAAPEAGAIEGWADGYFFVAEIGGQVVGFAHGARHDDELAVFPARDSYVELEDLFVAPRHRSAGLGAALARAVIAAARADGIARFSVFSSNRDQSRISAFYRRLGFVQWGVQLYMDAAPGAAT